MVDKDKFKTVLDDAQKLVNEAYEKDGLTDEILDVQVKINELRNLLNITDESERIYENWVQ